MSDGHHHRSIFSSKNRPFKGKSKGKAERLNRGKVDTASSFALPSGYKSASSRASFSVTSSVGAHRIPLKHSIELGTKEQRQHKAKQMQRAKKETLFQQKRIGNRQGPPKIIALIPLSATVDLNQIVTHIQAYADGTQEGVAEEMKKVEKSTNPLIHPIAVNMSGRQRRITLYSTPRDTNSVLDIAKVADIVMLVLGASPSAPNDDIDVDAFGTHVLAILKAQGMPAVMGIQVGVRAALPKKQGALRKLGGRYFDTACGADTKVLPLDTQEDAGGFFRWIASDVKLKPMAWRDSRPYMLCEQVAFEANKPVVPAFSFTLPGADAPVPTPTEQTGTLRVRGYLRGDNPLTANQLIHLTGYGDFQIAKIEGRVEEAAVYMTEKEKKQSRAASKAASKMVSRRGSIGDDEEMGDGESSMMMSASAAAAAAASAFHNGGSSTSVGSDVILQSADSAEQETLDSLVPIDPLANEQSIIEDDELLDEGHQEDEDEMEEKSGDAYDDEDEDDDEDGDASMGDVAPPSSSRRAGPRDSSGQCIESGRRKKFADLHPATAISASLKAASKPGALVKSQVAWDEAVPDDDEEDDEEDAEADAKFDAEGDIDGVPQLVEKRKLERDEQQFPDEVEFPMDTRCKDRFQRYRGLKSFQHSFWDSKENLPLEYGQIYQFANFEASKNRVMRDAILGEGVLEEDNSILTQRFYPVTIYLKEVPSSIAHTICNTVAPIVAFGLYKYEHKVSVLHFSIKRAHEYSLPIKAKEPLEFHVAFRRFVARPIYSHEGKSDKSMTARFFQQGDFVVASVYGRIIFPPASVIAFQPSQLLSTLMVGDHPAGALQQALLPQPLTPQSLSSPIPFRPIVASGTLLSVNPDRLLIKRIILTGSPISVHKRSAVIRHMFFNADDVRWFKPVELTTKYGLVGHIKEPRGTKGYMKAQFDKFIKQNDTVCMALYKRQYPPWNPIMFQGNL